jgi:hypothetical protein
MSNPLDSDQGTEQFDGYEAELKLVEADLAQKLDQIDELTGEERKAAIRGAERAVDEAKELVIRHCATSGTTWLLTASPARSNEPHQIFDSYIPALEDQFTLP